MEESHERFITVPKNAIGRREFRCVVRESDNIVFNRLSEDEFFRIYESGFLWAMNKRYGLMLDDFESGEISNDLEYVLAEAEKIKDSCPTLYKAVKQAVECGTEICFEL